MWPWRRDPPARPAPAATPYVPSPPGEWRSLPVVQREVAEHPLVNPPERFAAVLTSWRSPAFLAPLGHAVGAEEPAGVIAATESRQPAARADTTPLPVAGR